MKVTHAEFYYTVRSCVMEVAGHRCEFQHAKGERKIFKRSIATFHGPRNYFMTSHALKLSLGPI